MSKYAELVYMVNDEIKGMSDDFTYTEDHIVFLLNKYRAFLLKQKYSDVKKNIPDNNYQTLDVELMEVPAISGEPCEGGVFLKSKKKIPFIMNIHIPKVYNNSCFEITYVSRDRFRYVGYNKYLKNIIYCTIGPDNYMYFKFSNNEFQETQNVNITTVFQDAKEAIEFNTSVCDILDYEFPIEDNLISPLIELVVKELLGAEYRPTDKVNNAKDDLEEVSVKTK